MTWGDVTDNVGVTGYRVYRGSTLVGTVTDGSDTLVEDGLDDGVSYSYRVRGVRRGRQLQHRQRPGGRADSGRHAHRASRST